MPQLTGKSTIVGTFETGTAPTISYDALPVGTPTTWKIVAINASLEKVGEPQRQTDGNGKTNGLIFPEVVQRLEMTAKVQADTMANAQAAAVIPDPGSKITLANFIKSTHTLFNADFILETCKIELTDSETEPAKITLSATKFETATDTILATVS
jgi:hypothetical protein